MRAVTSGIIVIVGLAAVFCAYLALGETLAVITGVRRRDPQVVFGVISAAVLWLIAAAATFAAVRLFQRQRVR